MEPLNFLKNQNIEFLLQGRRLIEQLKDDEYRATGNPLAQSGVGSHFRHILDFYDCFSRGVSCGQIDYDARSRNRTVETDRPTALAALDEKIVLFETLSHSVDTTLPLQVSSNGPTGTKLWSQSTLLRELQVLIAHTVHHYALIALLLRSQGVEVAAGFGVAPSSLQFEEQRRQKNAAQG